MREVSGAYILGMGILWSIVFAHGAPVASREEIVNFSGTIPKCAFSDSVPGVLVNRVDHNIHDLSSTHLDEGASPSTVSFFSATRGSRPCVVMIGSIDFIKAPHDFLESQYHATVTGYIEGVNQTPSFYPVTAGNVRGLGYFAHESGKDTIFVHVTLMAKSPGQWFPTGTYQLNVPLTVYR